MAKLINRREQRHDHDYNSEQRDKSDMDHIQEFMIEWDEELKSLGQNSNKVNSIREFKIDNNQNEFNRNRMSSQHAEKRKTTVVEVLDRNNFSRSVLIESRVENNEFEV